MFSHTVYIFQISQWLAQLLECDPLPVKKLEKMEELYKMFSLNNSEIKFRWLRLGLKAHWTESVEDSLKFITEQGRMKFVRPIYRFVDYVFSLVVQKIITVIDASVNVNGKE